jgi:hypothetical protein
MAPAEDAIPSDVGSNMHTNRWRTLAFTDGISRNEKASRLHGTVEMPQPRPASRSASRIELAAPL